VSEETIDIDNATTFGVALERVLVGSRSVALGYRAEELRLLKDPDGSLAYTLRPNKFADERRSVIEKEVMPLLEDRTLLVWHYTRLLPHEAINIRSNGMKVSTFESMKARLMSARDHGLLDDGEVQVLINGSPLVRDENQKRCRSDKLFFFPKRLPVDASGVEPLTSSWGGEVIYFWQDNTTLKAKLNSMGVPSVVEAAIPLSTPGLCHRVAETLFDKLGNPNSSENFDCWIEHDLPKESIAEIHQPGSSGFAPFKEITP
jgi:hypothetical protein